MQKPKYLKLPTADRVSAGGFEKLTLWRTCLNNEINWTPLRGSAKYALSSAGLISPRARVVELLEPRVGVFNHIC